jgi:hypothetical protein
MAKRARLEMRKEVFILCSLFRGKKHAGGLIQIVGQEAKKLLAVIK